MLDEIVDDGAHEVPPARFRLVLKSTLERDSVTCEVDRYPLTPRVDREFEPKLRPGVAVEHVDSAPIARASCAPARARCRYRPSRA